MANPNILSLRLRSLKRGLNRPVTVNKVTVNNNKAMVALTSGKPSNPVNNNGALVRLSGLNRPRLQVNPLNT
jgi:hypothetical protein